MMGHKKVEENGSNPASGQMDTKSLEKRFTAVRDSAEEIQSVARLCLQQRPQQVIVDAWAKAVRKGIYCYNS